MIQYILVVLIGVGVVFILGRNIYKMFTKPADEDGQCSVGCSNCSLSQTGAGKRKQSKEKIKKSEHKC